MTAISAATGIWTLDPTVSTAAFTAHQLWLSVHGTIPFRSAEAVFSPGGELLSATAELDLAALDTGNARRERDLAKPALLDMVTHPTLTVHVGPGARTSDGWTAEATINARGAECVAQLRIVLDESQAGGRVSVRISTVLDRMPLGMRAPRLAIGRWVLIEVVATFTQR